MQNPPSIPMLLVAQIVCYLRHTKLVIDWHNFGYSILALKLGDRHPLVKLSKLYEIIFARYARAHFSVTNAMAQVLDSEFNVSAIPLHDRPADIFQPMSETERGIFMKGLPETTGHADRIKARLCRLLVSSTSWTADEDFSILLDALKDYSAKAEDDSRLPSILAIITGKGPFKAHFEKEISRLKEEGELQRVVIITAWLSVENYASLLASADIGISLHTSSSGVDLPMKVVDMFGAGLPVLGWSDFEAWKELVIEGVNGRGFKNAPQLTNLLLQLFGVNKGELAILRTGALKECNRRWKDEWDRTAGKVLGLC